MKLFAISPREHAKKIRAKRAASEANQSYKADSQRRIDWLVLLMMLIASFACFVFALRVLP